MAACLVESLYAPTFFLILKSDYKEDFFALWLDVLDIEEGVSGLKRDVLC